MNISNTKLFVSKRTVLPNSVEPAILVVKNGIIDQIHPFSNNEDLFKILHEFPDAEYTDFGNLVLMPGVVDSHVHINEPGRSNWEGFYSATKAAAAGGITTIIDMPLNSVPPTITIENLKIKASIAASKSFVNVGFWGGVVPGNQKDLKSLVDAGVVGFKCFMCPSGVDEFPYVNEEHIKNALSELHGLQTTLAFHAEIELDMSSQSEGDPFNYDTYLQTRPPIMEINAIKKIIDLCQHFNCHCHIVHLSAAEALDIIRKAKEKKASLSVETCYHYLHLAAENIHPKATEFKCAPPIRSQVNREKLWEAVKDGTLDMIVSDHSPCSEDLKGDGNFLKAWGGISSVQFGISLLWTEARERGLDFVDMMRLICLAPAKLCGLQNCKGLLKIGLDADFVVWDPDKIIKIERSNIIHKNKLTPYLGEELYGSIIATIIGGNVVYENGEFSNQRFGQLLLSDSFLSDLNLS